MRIYLTALMLVITLGLVSCGGGNETASTGASVTAQATKATVSACNTSASFGGAGPALTNTTNPTLEACNAAITFTCNASITFGGTEPALTATTSPSLKTCIAVMYETNSNNPNGAKVLAGQMTMSTATAACVGSPVASCWTITSASVCKSSYNANVGHQCGYTTYCFNDGASPCNSSVYVPVASSGSNVGQCLLKSFPACTQNMFGYPSSTAMWYAVEMGVTSTTCVWENALYCNSDTCPTTSCGGGGGGVVRGK